MLVVIPNGGLGNRLMAMVSAKVLAAHLGCEFQVLWRPESHLPYNDSPLSGLFDGFESFSSPAESFPEGAYFEHHTPVARPEIEERLKAGKMVFLRSYCFIRPQGMDETEFDALIRREFCTLQPRPELLARVPGLPEGTIGIQIRLGDNWRCTRYSPLALFFRVMDGCCRDNAGVRFYLSTDSKRVHRLVRKRYGDRILSYAPEPAWESEEGARARRAVVKVYTLARCACIYHSFMSSFSFISHLISHKPYICVGVLDRPGGWYGAPADDVHDRLIEWNPDAMLWQKKRHIPEESRIERLRVEWMLWRARFFCSKAFHLWPWHRMGPLE